MIRDGISEDGPTLITFAGILKYDLFPFTALLQDILEIGQKGMGCPVQIEFAVNLHENNEQPPTFAILQIRPLVPAYEYTKITWTKPISKESVFIQSTKVMGNGVITSIRDIVYVPSESFDSTKTIDIADEIGRINSTVSSPYLLIGPGRWGTTDRFLGIPVRWNQISGVKVMVETAFERFNVEPSQGTHFFHNVTSQGIGYIMIPFRSRRDFIDWAWLTKQPSKKSLNFVRHVRLKKPLTIKLDGKKGSAVVLKPET